MSYLDEVAEAIRAELHEVPSDASSQRLLRMYAVLLLAKGQSVDVRQALDSFRKLHSMMLDYGRTTDADLRAHAVSDWGVDTYQCLLEISTHTQRHILQIREIKADPAFPKS